MAEAIRGVVFDIQRYSLHDGPGIRTTVFLKGCPMRCAWCENPESIQANPQLAFYHNRCAGCGTCQPACPFQAIDLAKPERIDWERCNNCGRCAEACPSGALQLIGRYMTVEEVVQQVRRDRLFYEQSGGGVTVSGGEPTRQYDFLAALLQAFKGEGLHTVLETNGLLAWKKLQALTRWVDLIYLDLKGIDPTLHRQQTGVDNRLILSNARRLMAAGQDVVFRLPLIPGLNSAPHQLDLLTRFLDDIGAREVHLLPYHKSGEDKLRNIHTSQRGLPIPAMTHAEAERLKALFERSGRKVMIGGA